MVNPNLLNMDEDFLYHINIKVDKDTNDIKKQFGDIKFVCLGGTKSRMAALAEHLREVLQIDQNKELIDLGESGHRYAVYKVGPVLCCSHGIGMASMSVLLHELIKLVKYAECIDPVFMRIGTCGGLGVPPGTVVVTKDAYNGYLRNEHQIAVLGENIVRPAYFDSSVNSKIIKCHESTDNFELVIGNTLGTDCFYEGQGRLDGALCNYTLQDKMSFLKKCYELGIKNIEMEATMFSSLALATGIKAADICVTILNRLNGDQVIVTMAEKVEFEKRPFIVVGRYIKQNLQSN
ncbi:uridine phosphorylase 1 [Teleopsis dalmanni]|uniref:uridine phosphorylase 1 n=1 Tax=Teleopsis dalmanni TaxID=139649 RepID=UPI000D32ACC1|nr:uridine phosphorylase 1 [Teleopsis dalmanni]XP_037946725.1 uridine phosphorylase 1 [Teleopsis dalmanni]